MSVLHVAGGSVDFTLNLTSGGDQVLVEFLLGLAKAFRERGGEWLVLRDLKVLGELVDVQGMADVVWLPAATTSVSVDFDGPIPAAVADL